MADEEAFFVVVGIDEPVGDAVGAVADDFACLGFEDVYAFSSPVLRNTGYRTGRVGVATLTQHLNRFPGSSRSSRSIASLTNYCG